MYRSETVAKGWVGGHVIPIRLSLTDRPAVIAWSPQRAALFREGRLPVPDSGLESLKDIVFIAPGDFDNDGLTDLCVVTTTGAALYRNVAGKFRKGSDVASGAFRQAVGHLWWTVPRRRSQGNHLPWHRMTRLVARWLPSARICHPYPLVRLGVLTRGGSRMR